MAMLDFFRIKRPVVTPANQRQKKREIKRRLIMERKYELPKPKANLSFKHIIGYGANIFWFSSLRSLSWLTEPPPVPPWHHLNHNLSEFFSWQNCMSSFLTLKSNYQRCSPNLLHWTIGHRFRHVSQHAVKRQMIQSFAQSRRIVVRRRRISHKRT